MSISMKEARSILLGGYANVKESSNNERKANVFFSVNDKAASSLDNNRISLKQARSLLTDF